jgi:hypothetical protein
MPRRFYALFAAPLFVVIVLLGLTHGGGSAVAAEKPKAAAATFEVYQDKGGEYRWRLRALNSQILATAPDGYKEKRSCLAAIESVKRDAATAPVAEETAKP